MQKMGKSEKRVFSEKGVFFRKSEKRVKNGVSKKGGIFRGSKKGYFGGSKKGSKKGKMLKIGEFWEFGEFRKIGFFGGVGVVFYLKGSILLPL